MTTLTVGMKSFKKITTNAKHVFFVYTIIYISKRTCALANIIIIHMYFTIT